MTKNQTSGCLPFSLAAIAYLIFSFFNRSQVGQGIWVLVALLVIPALAALTVQRGAPGDRQRTAFWAVLWAMVLYTIVNLSRIRLRIDSGEPGGNLLAGLLACLIYGGIAGGIAALVVRLRAPKRETKGEKK